MQCTLCLAQGAPFSADRTRQFFRCPQCDLIFAEQASYLSPADEKQIYDYHENSADDPRYRKFLSQLSEPLLTKLTPGMQGLDFGCGPGPTINLMLQEQGMSVALYDLFYFPDSAVLTTQYDFVTATEVVEHFNNPRQDWPILADVLKPGGWLGVMTWLYSSPDNDNFCRWSYKGDPTHVSFYTPETMKWLARWLNLELQFVSERVILFRKPGVDQGRRKADESGMCTG